MSLQERTLVVKNFNPKKVNKTLLEELFLQAGPVKNVVVKPDHAFVEFEDVDSVGYSKALLEGIRMHGKQLILVPKVNTQDSVKYTQLLQNYIRFTKQQQSQQQQLLMQQQRMQHQQHAQVQFQVNPFQQTHMQQVQQQQHYQQVQTQHQQKRQFQNNHNNHHHVQKNNKRKRRFQ